MKRTPLPLLVPVLAFAACSTPKQIPDLSNELVYRDVAFTTKLPGDRSVFVAPLADDRHGDVLPAAQTGHPIVYDADGRWQRTPVEMVDEVLRRELQESGLFAAVAGRGAAADVVVTPSLVTFATGAMELDTFAVALAEVALRVRVFGPCAADGSRPLLLDQVYGDRQVTEGALRPPSRFPLAGLATQNTMQRVLQALDGSNVGRSDVPVVPAGPAPAGPPAGPPADGR